MPADDLTDPAAVHVFSHLSASIVLSRKRASEGLYPAIDLLQSNSKMATPGIVGQQHYNLAQEIRKTLAQYDNLKDIVAMLGLEQLSPEDRKTVGRARRLERFLTQPFFTTEKFSGMKGKLVGLKDSLDGCERILRDEFKDYPESALYMIGAIGEAKNPNPHLTGGPCTNRAESGEGKCILESFYLPKCSRTSPMWFASRPTLPPVRWGSWSIGSIAWQLWCPAS